MNIADSVGGGILRNISSLRYTIQNSGTLNINSGTVYHQTNTAIYNHAADSGNAIVNVTGGTVKCVTICIYDQGSRDSSRNEHYSGTNITGGEILIDEPSNSAQYGLYVNDYALNPSITGGRIRIERNSGTGTAIGLYSRAYDVTINVGANNNAIIINTPTSSATGIYNDWTAVNLISGNISVTGGGTMTGIQAGGTATINPDGKVIASNTGNGAAIGTYAHTNKMIGGSVSATAISGNAVGAQFCDPGRNLTMSSGTITAHSISGNSMGTYVPSGCGRQRLNFSGGTITATSDSGTAYGAYVGNVWSTITGGKIQGDDYGVYNYAIDRADYYDIIGANDSSEPVITSPEIIGGQYGYYGGRIYFYDGVLRGHKAYQDGTIVAIPDGTTYHIEPSSDYDENCWLVQAANYLSVDDVEYNSLKKAYDAITGSSGTVKVIADAQVEAVLPSMPANKAITFDLNGHNLIYTQPLLVDQSSSSMTIVDNSTNHDGRLYNPSDNGHTINHAAGTLNITSGTIGSANITIYKADWYGSTVNINGGTVECDKYCLNSDGHGYTVNLSAGQIVSKDTGTSEQIAIQNVNNLNITGGQIRMVRAANSTNTSSITAISSGTITINTDNSQPVIYIDAPTASYAHAFIDANATVSNSTISVNGKNSYGFVTDGGRRSLDMTGSALDIHGTTSATGIHNGSVNINTTSTVSATSTDGTAYGVYYLGHWRYGQSDIKLNNGVVTATSTNGKAYGAYGESSEGVGGRLTMYDGTLYGASDNNAGYGIYTAVANDTTTIIGGTVFGSTDGIHANYYGDNYSAFTIGEDDGTIDANSPAIIGATAYGINRGRITFNDGRIRGAIAAHYDRNIKYIPDYATLASDTEIIGGTTYQVEYLTTAHNVAQIGSTGYTSLAAAIAAANTGDTIELLEDNYLYYDLEIPDTKDITIETAGFKFIAINPIVNNGTVTITNSSATAPLIDYIENGYFITNNAGASLTLQNLNLSAGKVIDNKGALSLDHTTITASDVAIKNTGTTSVNNSSVLDGGNYAFYSENGTNSITGSTIANGAIYSNSGNLSLVNTTATIPSNAITEPTTFITNNSTSGTLTLDNFQADYTRNSSSGNMIYNKGTATISNSTMTQHGGYTIIYNDGGSVSTAATNLTYAYNDYSWEASGVRMTSGTFSMTTGSISVTNLNRTAYGIYSDSGIVTLGVAEPGDSADYGQPTAHVDNTNPSISAIGTYYGQGIYFSNGQVYFYDGISTGSSSAIDKDPSVIEYLWRAKYGTDGDGYHYMIQEYAQN